jgi:hypothetical protein
MDFIEGLFDDSIYHKGMDSAKWKFLVSTEHDALQQGFRLPFAIFLFLWFFFWGPGGGGV